MTDRPPIRGGSVRCAILRRTTTGIPAIACLLVLVACQHGGSAPPTVSLEEAEAVTAELAEPFEAPPRTINDLLAALPDPGGKLRKCSGYLLTPDELILIAAEKLTGWRSRANFFIHHAGVRFELGDFPGSVKFQRLAVNKIPLPHFRASSLGMLAVYHSYSNDFDAAESAMVRSDSIPLKKNFFAGPHASTPGTCFIWESHAAPSLPAMATY